MKNGHKTGVFGHLADLATGRKNRPNPFGGKHIATIVAITRRGKPTGLNFAASTALDWIIYAIQEMSGTAGAVP